MSMCVSDELGVCRACCASWPISHHPWALTSLLSANQTSASLAHTFTPIIHYTVTSAVQSRSLSGVDRCGSQSDLDDAVRPERVSHQVLYKLFFTLSYWHTHTPPPPPPAALSTHPFYGTVLAIKRFLNEGEALRLQPFEWILWMTQSPAASWEADEFLRKRQPCWELSWEPVYLILTSN